MSTIATKSLFPPQALSRQKVKVKKGAFSFADLVKVMVIVLCITLFYLWSRLEVISLGYEIARANKERGELIVENKRLKLEMMALKSPERIEPIAREKFGLEYPKGEQLIRVK